MSYRNQYLSTKEFADLVNVPKHVIIYYDEIDLLKPDHIEENGYRYYHRDQYFIFNTISFLKTVGVSLKEIKEYLHHRSPAALVEILHEKESIIDQKIQSLKSMKKLITYIEQMTVHGMGVDSTDVHFEYREAVKMLTSNQTQSHLNPQYVEDLTLFAREHQLTLTTFVGVMIHYQNVVAQEITHYDKLFALLLSNDHQPTTAIRSEGYYLVTHHSGSFDTIQQSYNKIIEYAKEHDISLDDYFYEQTLLNDLTQATPDDFLVEISIRCQ